MNRKYIESIAPFSSIFWSGVIICGMDEQGDYLIRHPHKLEDPDYYSVYIKRLDGSVSCVADLATAEEADLFVKMFKELHENYKQNESGS